MPFDIFGAANRNAERRKAEGKAFKNAKEQWRAAERRRKKDYDFSKDQYKSETKFLEDTTRFQEEEMIRGYESAQEMRDFEFNTAQRAYEKSLDQSWRQRTQNSFARDAAMMEQIQKKHDDLLAVAFDESQNVIDFGAETTGLKLKKHSAFAQADMQEAGITSKFYTDMGGLDLARRKARGESMIAAQKEIVAGMKAAGTVRSLGSNGRSAVKATLGVLAESGAARSAIANGLMYAENQIDLGVAQLKDMLILDQTKVLFARNTATNEYDLNFAKADATNSLNNLKFGATRNSIEQRDAVVRRKIELQRKQADLNAEAAVLLKPERLPDLPDPRTIYAKYDNPDTTDYVEMILRPTMPDFPDFVSTPEPKREDFKGPRENVGLSNLGDILKIGGFAATGIGGLGGLGAFGATFAKSAVPNYLSTIGSGMTKFSSSFYPR
tara:strand:- start:3587 stop:4903 length:1317 start_codon:yes stop_codon:yes gene_type:complete